MIDQHFGLFRIDIELAGTHVAAVRGVDTQVADLLRAVEGDIGIGQGDGDAAGTLRRRAQHLVVHAIEAALDHHLVRGVFGAVIRARDKIHARHVVVPAHIDGKADRTAPRTDVGGLVSIEEQVVGAGVDTLRIAGDDLPARTVGYRRPLDARCGEVRAEEFAARLDVDGHVDHAAALAHDGTRRGLQAQRNDIAVGVGQRRKVTLQRYNHLIGRLVGAGRDLAGYVLPG